ncbi:TPA: hypothetical protein DDX30_02935 [Candidatus Wolfebacteria bacterium]|nr:hypothetical protein [Candidatus Wolfebacteria bacterium]
MKLLYNNQHHYSTIEESNMAKCKEKEFHSSVLLQCAVCPESPRGTGKQCSKGHLFCKECAAKHPTCPICGEPLSDILPSNGGFT